MANPATGQTSGQFISVQKFHAAKLLTDSATGTTYDTPLDFGKILRQVQIAPTNSSVNAYADGQSIDTAVNTAEFELTIETAALPLEYIAFLLGHTYENGTMITSKDDVAPYFAIMYQSDKRNGKARYQKFYKVQFQEPEQTNKTAEENIEFQFPTMKATAIYRLSDGRAYAYGDDEDANFDASTWYTAVDLLTSPNLTVSPASLTLDSSNSFTDTVTVTQDGTGAISATSDNTDITASVSGNTITITGTNTLTSATTGTVTVSVASDGTYSGQTKTVAVTVAAGV